MELIPCPGEGDDANHVSLTLRFVFPESYPDVVPSIDLSSGKGLKDEALEELHAKLASEAEDSVGMPMIFNLAESAKEYLLENNVKSEDTMSMHEQMVERKRRAKEAEDEAKRKAEEAAEKAAAKERQKNGDAASRAALGTPVTPESFAAWKQKFDEEMRAKNPEVVDETQKGKLTGRQLFERNVAPEAAEKDANVAALVAHVEEASLFLDGDSDDDDLDLDEFSDDDDDNEEEEE